MPRYFLIPLLLVQCLTAAEISVYPLSAIYMSKEVQEKIAFVEGLGASSEDRSLTKGRQAFVRDVRWRFPKTVDAITKMNTNRTFITYLKVPRVSMYEVEKPDGTVDYYLPVTATVTMANMKTGEIVYASALTDYTVYRGLEGGLEASKQRELYAERMLDAIGKLTEKAGKAFNPFHISAEVTETYEGNAILDKGSENGILKGDMLESASGKELKVIYSDAQYAVAKPLLGEAEAEEIYTKTTSGSLSTLKKERVGLSENRVDYPYFSWDTMKQFFTDAIGENASFTILPIDRTFYAARQQAFEESKSGLSQEYGMKRPLPSMYVNVGIGSPYSWKTPSDKPYVFFEDYAVDACALMCNADGIITYSACSAYQQHDKVVGGARFSSEATYEKITKNALLQIAENFSEHVRPSVKRARVDDEDDGVVTIAGITPFVSNENVTLYHYLSDAVKVPVAEGRVFDTDNGKVELFFDADVDEDDEVVSRYLGKNIQDTLLSFGPTEVLDGLNLHGFEAMARYVVAENAPYNCLAWPAIAQNMRDTFSPAFGFEKKLKMKFPETRYIAVPRYMVKEIETECEENVCKSVFKVFGGIRVYKEKINNDSIAYKNGYITQVTVNHIEGDSEKRQFELNKAVMELLAKASKEIRL